MRLASFVVFFFLFLLTVVAKGVGRFVVGQRYDHEWVVLTEIKCWKVLIHVSKVVKKARGSDEVMKCVCH